MDVAGGNERPLNLGEIAQVALVVQDLQQAMQTYWKVLGIGPWSIYTYAPSALRETMVRGKPVEYSMRLAIAHVGALQVELIQPLEGPSIYKEFLAKQGEGLHHIQSRVDDIAKTLAAFREQGVDVLMSGKFGEGEFYYMDTERLFGFPYEVVKRRTRPAPEATYPSDSAPTIPR